MYLEFEEDDKSSYSEKAYDCIKNFVPKIDFDKQPNGSVRCRVQILKGKRIVDYPHLLKFEAEGYNIFDAKENAFKVFVASLRNETER